MSAPLFKNDSINFECPSFDVDLSPMDALHPIHYSRRLHIFQSTDEQFPRQLAALKVGINALLAHCPMLGGTVRPHEGMGRGAARPGVDYPCTIMLGYGLELVLRDLRTVLPSYQELEANDFSMHDLPFVYLVPVPQGIGRSRPFPACKMQLTAINGGSILTFSMSHSVADGSGTNALMSVLCEAVRKAQEGQSGMELETTKVEALDRTFLRDITSNVPFDIKDHPAFRLPGESATSPSTHPFAATSPEFPFQVRLSATSLARLKADATAISTHDALCSLIWRTLLLIRSRRSIAARSIPASTPVLFLMPSDARKQLGIDPSYVGNVVYQLASSLDLGTLLGPEGLKEGAKAVRKSITSATPELVRSYFTELKSRWLEWEFLSTASDTSVAMGTDWTSGSIYEEHWGEAFGGKMTRYRFPSEEGGVYNCVFPKLPDGGAELIERVTLGQVSSKIVNKVCNSTSKMTETATTVTKAQPDPRTIRLKGIINTTSHEGSNGLYLGSKLPLECFLSVLSSPGITEHDLISFTQVCSNWRRAILSAGSLWTELVEVDLSDLTTIDRVRFVAGRKGGLTKLAFNLDQAILGDYELDGLPIAASMRMILWEIAKTDGGKSLHDIELDITAYRGGELVVVCNKVESLLLTLPGFLDNDIEPAYILITLLIQFATFAASNLHSLKILTSLPRFPGGSPFLNALPKVKEVTITSDLEEPFGESRLPDFFSSMGSGGATESESQILSCEIEKWTLSGLTLMDRNFPQFPCLATLQLYDVRLSNLRLLLELSRTTLKHLSLHNVVSDPTMRWIPVSNKFAVKDVPPPLILPALESVDLCGVAPNLWKPIIAESDDGFLVEAQRLKKVSFSSKERFDAEAANKGYGRHYSVYHGLTKESLSTLIRTSPFLEELDLEGLVTLSTMTLLECLPHAGHQLRTLNISKIPTVNDHFLTELYPHLPFLTHLIAFDTQVTLPALARLGQKLRQTKPPLRAPGFLSMHPIKISYSEKMPNTSDQLLKSSALQVELRKVLVSLSVSQISTIVASIHFNPPPGPKNPSFESFTSHVQGIGTPVPLPSTLGPMMAAVKIQEMGEKEPERMVADWKTVGEARLKLQEWQKRREWEWAKEWCDSQRVELIMGRNLAAVEDDSEDEDEFGDL